VAGVRTGVEPHHRAVGAQRSRHRLRGPRLGDHRLLQLVSAGVVSRDTGSNAAISDVHNGQRYIFCSEPCREIFLREPERYAAHKDLVQRVLAGEAPGNLMGHAGRLLRTALRELGQGRARR